MADRQEELTVLDWFRSLLRLKPIPIPEPGEAAPVRPRAKPVVQPPAEAAPQLQFRLQAAQLRIPLALILALFAQFSLAQHRAVPQSVALYLLAGGLFGWAVLAGDLGAIAALSRRRKSPSAAFAPRTLAVGVGLAGLTYLTAGENTFRLATVVFWVASVVVTAAAFWVGESPLQSLWGRLRAAASKPSLQLKLERWHLLLGATFALAAYFRLTQLAQVPIEMWSDHAEKILDIIDVLNGNTSIYFPRNAGREAMQFYLTAATVKWLGAELSFMTLKSVTAVAGLLTLPYFYLLGRELGDRWLGLAALALAGVAAWPNVMARVGLRAVFHPMLLAPALYYFLRGLRQRRSNDLLLSGVAIGLGIYGYTAARITPLVIAAGASLYLLHRPPRRQALQSLGWLAMAALMALVVAAPYLRAAIELPDQVFYRTVTRDTDAERALAGPPLEIFLSNLWTGLRMFSWDFGEIWVLAVPFKPALDWVTGALFHVGLVALLVRYARRRAWEDLFLVVAIPILLLPSVLALAFPGENPHPSRAGGAVIPVFLIAGFALAGIARWGTAQFSRSWTRYGPALLLFALAATANYGRVMVEYSQHTHRGLWNTSEVGRAARGFGESIGDFQDIYVVGFPHWLDSRLVAVNAGHPGADYGVLPEALPQVPESDEPQLFILHPQDQPSLDFLRQRYPQGALKHVPSPIEGRDFLLFWTMSQAEA